MAKIIVLDFDDTLVLSEHIKQRGFVDIFSSIHGANKIAQNYVDNNFGRSRYEMIKGILNELKNYKLIYGEVSEELAQEYVRKFGELVEKRIIEEKEVEGASNILARLSATRLLYLNSNTPQDSIERIIERRGWREFFKGIFGSPPGTKVEHLERIVELTGVAPAEIVVAGDGESDLESAKKTGTSFIGVNGPHSKWLSQKNDFTLVNNLEDILKFIY